MAAPGTRNPWLLRCEWTAGRCQAVRGLVGNYMGVGRGRPHATRFDWGRRNPKAAYSTASVQQEAASLVGEARSTRCPDLNSNQVQALALAGAGKHGRVARARETRRKPGR
jgi:hypothetical protein